MFLVNDPSAPVVVVRPIQQRRPQRARRQVLHTAPRPSWEHERNMTAQQDSGKPMADDMNRVKTPSPGIHIGLIGGLAMRAGIFYYEQIQRRSSSAGTTLDLSLRHADVNTVLGHVSAGDRHGLGQYLGGLSNQLFDGGADLVAVTAVAPHMAIREITAAAKGRIVNLLEVVPETLEASGFERVAVFGNRAVMNTDIYGAVDSSRIVRLDPELLETIHETYNDIALAGKRNTSAEVELLAGVADEMTARGAQAIILAGTDLSSFYSETPPEFPYLDLAQVHIDQIMASS